MAEHVALSLAADYRNLDFRGALPKIGVPTLIVGANQDASTGASESEVIADLVPDSRLVVIQGSGHFVQLEKPDETNAAIRRFLEERVG